MVVPIIAAIATASPYISLGLMSILSFVTLGNLCFPWCSRKARDVAYLGYRTLSFLKADGADVMVSILMKTEPFYEQLPLVERRENFVMFQVNHSQGVAIFHVPKSSYSLTYTTPIQYQTDTRGVVTKMVELFSIETIYNIQQTNIDTHGHILGIRMVWESSMTTDINRFLAEIELSVDSRKRKQKT